MDAQQNDDDKVALRAVVARGTADYARDLCAELGLFSGRGPTSGRPSVSQLFQALADGALRVVKVEKVDDAEDA